MDISLTAALSGLGYKLFLEIPVCAGKPATFITLHLVIKQNIKVFFSIKLAHTGIGMFTVITLSNVYPHVHTSFVSS